ncbi:uncharacterized protein LOC141885625 [Acropora palmata]|uniref:uncharacterized protein LOC141885625 n=1 Tax=Acropora palmata TaxID=6131 RepID=UPI003DA184EF
MFFLSFFLIFFVGLDKTSSVRSPERPVVPNVTAISSTEVRITWCRVNSNKVEIDHYELYIDTQLEYSGIDVIYVAKRLKPWSWYEVKLRACGFSPASCSPFSRPALVKTMQDGDNTTNTVTQSGVNILQTIVVPTYTFILGMIAGILAISFILTWRYLQCMDVSGGSTFELPQHITTARKDEYSTVASMKEKHSDHDNFLNHGNLPFLLQVPPLDESKYLEIPTPSKLENHHEPNSVVLCDAEVILPMPRGQQDRHCLTQSQVQNEKNGMLFLEDFYSADNGRERQSVISMDFVSLGQCNESRASGYLENDVKPVKDAAMVPLKDDDLMHSKRQEETESCRDKNLNHFCDGGLSDMSQTSVLETPLCPSLSEHAGEILHVSNKALASEYAQMSDMQSYSSDEELISVGSSQSSLFSSDRIIVAIDNSNIYIGAQECASLVNAGDRKRHVRVKLQNLVKILEKERLKVRGFACGSSPPATEHVWDVYRRLGYIVDLEERRGRDEQRVDEGLHLWIYKALCELSPGVLVLATGDGMKGKSECDTSFPRCAVTALERGWTVELYSWKHSLSSEWIKLSKKYPDRLTIDYLDKYVNYITFVDGKNGRKCSQFPAEK